MASARKKCWFDLGAFVNFDDVGACGTTYKNAQLVLRCSQKAKQMADQFHVFFYLTACCYWWTCCECVTNAWQIVIFCHRLIERLGAFCTRGFLSFLAFSFASCYAGLASPRTGSVEAIKNAWPWIFGTDGDATLLVFFSVDVFWHVSQWFGRGLASVFF